MSKVSKTILIGAATGALSLALYELALKPSLKRFFPNLGV
jgi:hypothetical protein